MYSVIQTKRNYSWSVILLNGENQSNYNTDFKNIKASVCHWNQRELSLVFFWRFVITSILTYYHRDIYTMMEFFIEAAIFSPKVAAFMKEKYVAIIDQNIESTTI